jgi:molybdate transport system ATP-binding protein
VQIAAGAARILARITRQSSERLGLVPGRPVIAVIKSMAIDRRGLA